MAPLTPRRVFALLMLIGVALCIVDILQIPASAQTTSQHNPSASVSHTRAIKRTWQTGPASMPLQTEVVPPHPASIPPIIRGQAPATPEGKRAAGLAGNLSGSALAATRTPAGRRYNEVTQGKQARPSAPYVDPDKKALEDLRQLREDTDARRAFYENLRRTVQQVRSGEKVTLRPTSSSPQNPDPPNY
jgi:hypothetical protein